MTTEINTMTTEIKVTCECHKEEEAIREEILKAHIDFAEQNKAEFFNLGWAEGENFIHSKTSKGRIYTERNEEGAIISEFTQ